MSSIYDVIGALADFIKAVAAKSCPSCEGCDLHKEMENLLDHISSFRKYEPHHGPDSRSVAAQKIEDLKRQLHQVHQGSLPPPMVAKRYEASQANKDFARKEIERLRSLQEQNDRLQDAHAQIIPILRILCGVIDLLIEGIVKAKAVLGRASNVIQENDETYAALSKTLAKSREAMIVPPEPIEFKTDLEAGQMIMEVFDHITRIRRRLAEENEQIR